MGKNININSEEWRDVVFADKNKTYGAYKLRSTSSKRYVVAFLVVLGFVGIVGAVPYLMKEVQKQIEKRAEGTKEEVKMAEVEEPEEPEEEVLPPENLPPPPPPVKASIQFTPPVIAPDEQVTEDNQIKDQEDLNKDKGLEIGNFNNLEGSRDANAISADQAFQNTQVTGTGDAKPKEQIFKVVEQMPEYPGGQSELFKYLSSNIKYPTIAAENGIEGRVIITFVVGKDGSITSVKVARSLDPSCDKEAVRVVKSMPKWVPGRQNGQNVTVEYTLPVTFKLQK
ncbi:energy transducer TonB [Dysgonomonas sp. 520]|uniref:energy transducer TonB n=1 Tax=Dysgonomonas sp. 520 TaxID=2302931 RepID=UPI0013D6E6F8|nr:energy transducer TonB [Dysgonomonas sp. 520]NDW11103.1 energy transducer TonB [Dysgonomonas sp. 520]